MSGGNGGIGGDASGNNIPGGQGGVGTDGDNGDPGPNAVNFERQGGGGGGGAGGGDGGKGGDLTDSITTPGATGGQGGNNPGDDGNGGGSSGVGAAGGGGGGAHGLMGGFAGGVNAAPIEGGAGGAGGNSTNRAAGGGGAGGYGALNSNGANENTIRGGDGGAGGRSTGGGSGGGGDGGYGAVFSGTNTSIGTIQGGNGGNAGSNGNSQGGHGGRGGYGAVLTGTTTNDGIIQAGNGGAGGSVGYGFGGSGGNGGVGVEVGSGFTFNNSGTVEGGDGGTRGNGGAPVQAGAFGSGGAGIVGSGVSIVNAGTVTGGTGGSGAQANAITFTGGTNTLTLLSGSTITGNVIADDVASTDDTLALSGTGTGTANAGQFQGFEVSRVDGGTWTLSGTTTASWTVDGGTLGGTATLGALTVNAGGKLAPGSSPGILNTGNLSLASGATFEVEIGGTTPGQYDQVNVTGTVTLTGTTLDALLYGGFDPETAGVVSYVIINNDGTDAVTGTFAGLAEGALVSIGASRFTISYQGGSDSNDVVLTELNDAPSFSQGDGIVTTSIGTTQEYGRSVTVQPDGKIVVAGYTQVPSPNNSNYDFALLRYNPDGSLDTSFGGGDGIVTTSIGQTDQAYSVTLLPDGRLVVTGRTGNKFGLVRYNADGSLDTSFDGDGIVITSHGDVDRGYSVTALPDGKLVVAGSSDSSFALVRYNPNGSLDTSFGGDGIVITPIGLNFDAAYSVTALPDGRLVAAGRSSGFGTPSDFALVRYNPDGSLDTSFGGGDGIVITSIRSFDDVGRSVTALPDGKLVVAGYSPERSLTESSNDIALVRYNADGSLDTSFGGGDGIVITPIGPTADEGYSVTALPDGKLVVAGVSNRDFALVRYNADGSLDTSFGGGDGIVTTPIGSGTDVGYSVAVQPDGKLVVAGYSRGGGVNEDFAVVRYNADGSLDLSFDTRNTLNATPTYVENGAAVVLDADAAIFDAELEAANSYFGATLTLVRSSGANADDVFGGSGTLSFTGTGSGDLVLDGVTTVGTYTQSSGTLAITFNANATNARTDSVLRQLAYSNTDNTPPASVQIDYIFNDGNSGNAQGAGANPGIANGSITVVITAANDAPTAPASNSVTTDEDTASTAVAIGATDAENDALSYSVKTGFEPAKGSVSFSNGSFVYTPTANANGSDSFILLINDGNGGTTEQAVTVAINAINDAPVVVAPAGLSTNEDTSLAVTGFSVSDIESTTLTVTLIASSTLTLSQTTGLSFTVGDGTNDAAMTFSGTVADINAALTEITYLPTANFSGTGGFSYSIDDGTDIAPGGVAITVGAVNDGPAMITPATIAALEDQPVALTGIAFSDTDAGVSAIVVTLSVATGTLSATSGSGVTVGGGSTAVSLTGSIAAINAFLAASRLSYAPVANANGNVTLDIVISDGGSTGSGGPKLVSGQTTLAIAAVDDAPTLSVVPTVGSFSETADTSNARKVADITVSDIDGGSNVLSLGGADKDLFVIIGNELFLKAGANLDFETNAKLDVLVVLAGSGGGAGPFGIANLSIDIADVAESINGTKKDNVLTGTSASEIINGKGGDDTIKGGGGADTIIGGRGADVLVGGAGPDVFVFRPGDLPRIDDSDRWLSPLNGDHDLIRDFKPGIDTIDLSAIDANTIKAGNQKFHFEGKQDLSGSRGELVYELYGSKPSARHTIVRGDTNGDGDYDLLIVLKGHHHLAAGDFVL